MSDENDNNDNNDVADESLTGTSPGSPEDGGKSTERYFSQEEVNAILKNRLAKERRKVRDELRSKSATEEAPQPKQPESGTQGNQQVQELAAQFAEMKRRESLIDLLDEMQLQVTKAQRKMLLKVYDERDPEGSISEAVEAFGIGKASKQSEALKVAAPVASEGPKDLPAQPPASQAPSVVKPKLPDPGAPRVDGDDYPIDLTRLSRDQVEALQGDGDRFREAMRRYRRSLGGHSAPLFPGRKKQ